MLNYKKYGDSKECLFILHGLFGSLDNWQSLAQKFASNFTVYIVDQRNHGKSPHFKEHNYTSMASDLKDLMDQQQYVDKDKFDYHQFLQ
jgi:esterase